MHGNEWFSSAGCPSTGEYHTPHKHHEEPDAYSIPLHKARTVIAVHGARELSRSNVIPGDYYQPDLAQLLA